MKFSWEVDIKTVSEANSSQHWTIKAARHKSQQLFVRLSYMKHVSLMQLPCEVTMTRLAPRLLDDDNLRSAFKWIRDEISECVLPEKRKVYISKNGKVRAIKGRADNDPRITWNYAQEKRNIQGIRIEIEF